MPFSTSYPADPREFIDAASRAEFFQDVVAAASRVLHGQELTSADREQLETCRQLLVAAASSEIALPGAGLPRLADDPEALSAVLSATDGPPAERLKELGDSIKGVLADERTDAVLQDVAALRMLFVAAGRRSLSDSVRSAEEREPDSSWMRLSENSPS